MSSPQSSQISQISLQVVQVLSLFFVPTLHTRIYLVYCTQALTTTAIDEPQYVDSNMALEGSEFTTQEG